MKIVGPYFSGTCFIIPGLIYKSQSYQIKFTKYFLQLKSPLPRKENKNMNGKKSHNEII